MVFTCQVNCLAASQGGTGGRENSEGRRRKASREDTTRAEANCTFKLPHCASC